MAVRGRQKGAGQYERVGEGGVVKAPGVVKASGGSGQRWVVGGGSSEARDGSSNTCGTGGRRWWRTRRRAPTRIGKDGATEGPLTLPVARHPKQPQI